MTSFGMNYSSHKRFELLKLHLNSNSRVLQDTVQEDFDVNVHDFGEDGTKTGPADVPWHLPLVSFAFLFLFESRDVGSVV